MSVFVPERFRRTVLAHAVAVASFERYPLILAIQGPPGDGKSFQVRHVLRENGFPVIADSSALLAGSFEAEPVRQLRAIYIRARDLATVNDTRLPVILLEDFDLSPAGQKAGVRYTVNSQLLTAFLMNLADDVASCEVETTQRFPIFLTGNDFSLLSHPLTRPGRMNIFSWEPTDEERSDVIHAMLRPYMPALERREVERLSRQYRRFPISIFDAAIMDCLASAAFRHVEITRNIDTQQLRQRLGNGFNINLEEFKDAIRERSGPHYSPRNFLGGQL